MMLPRRWYAVLLARQLKRKRPLAITRFGEDLVLWRDRAGRVVCMRDQCPHRSAPLSLGRVVEDCVECPYHGFRYDGSGRCTLMPFAGPGARVPPRLSARTFPAREAHGLVWVWWGGEAAELPAIPWLEDFKDDLARSSSTQEIWQGHWTRVMEANVDSFHFPILHRRAAPFLGPRLVGYKVEQDGDVIRTEGRFCQPGHESKGVAFRVAMIFPNLMFDVWTSKLRVFAVSTPVDQGRTWVATRVYQEYIPFPGLRRLAAWIILQLVKRVVQPADKRIIQAQRLREGPFDAEQLVSADKVTILFEKQRARAMEPEAEGRPLGIETLKE